jgi:dolichyl-phosphate-mannose--protein O-mannosyl transferase
MTEIGNAGGGREAPQIRLTHALLVGVIFLAAFTRLWRLGEPTSCYFDEVYFPTTGAEILHGDNDAWEFYGHENTHPPLSKDLMAIGMAIFGTYDLSGGENNCWGDEDDKEKRTSNDWAYEPFGFRFPGALAGIFSVIFMYLLARKLFKSEVAGLVSAFLLSIDGLVLTQSRIATPDAYVLCFVLGSMYFLVTRRWLFSGLLLGAAASTKWNGAFLVLPIVLFFAWQTYDQWRRLDQDPRLREAERVLLVGAFAIAVGAVMTVLAYVAFDGLSSSVLLVGGAPAALGLFVIVGGLIAILTEQTLRSTSRGRLYLNNAISFPIFFILIPGIVYLASYTPMFFNGHGLAHLWDINRMAYEFHSSLGSPHPYQSEFWSWPIDLRPVYFHLGSGRAKIYNLGNPIIFWMAIPALVYTLWQGVRWIRFRVEEGAYVRLWGRIMEDQLAPLFVMITYLAFWLALVTQGRALFLYHYQQAFSIAVLALGFTSHKLWYHPHPWSRHIVIAFLAASFTSFIYFYPHWTAVDVPNWLDDSYYWFPDWS